MHSLPLYTLHSSGYLGPEEIDRIVFTIVSFQVMYGVHVWQYNMLQYVEDPDSMFQCYLLYDFKYNV